jgi:hypothetical protein
MRSRSLAQVALFTGALVGLGCTDLFPPDPTVNVSLSVEWTSSSSYRLTTGVGGKRVELSADPESTAAVVVRLPRTGSLPVHLVVRSAAGDSIAGFSFEQTFRRDADQWIAVSIGRLVPFSDCQDPTLEPRVAVSGADSAFVETGSLDKGAMC